MWLRFGFRHRTNTAISSIYNEPLTFETEGPIEIIGPKTVALQGGMGGAYVKSKRLQPGEKQNAALIIRDCDTEIKIGFTVESERNFKVWRE